ncbi:MULTISPECIES: MerR family transcriptional regulator [unclassified Streptomyces]|uniref:MerR family DNA-binding transcriptional regulator n=1 Tax=Streptomyces evansiae TaxID=3075535 RepID=A0ABU2R9M1_9ACTN|nr:MULTISPECIES: MerR family transcriptional regulator [unclassified Streptomyces]EFL00900.1 Zn(II)-responsive transcriptional regulator [Streptomyces sp. SPB78]MDT0413305.1 MerR family DNA-binding transcriptional regulator [Streptomyces sp. DSM 41979]MDT0421921.1 MerR family DNA-binding transcriptional regulator [Streptomyces sp. DSM 41859]MYQ56871.1 MerR family DNA-binding transcriptional regulator [Streptomyces sp. SID4926]MYR30203.1 MerR family DNA-binding transcriptional regulator [Strept
MKIGELAKRAEVSVRSLRYYEQQGLLESTRTPGGQRVYAEEALGRVQLIQLLYAAGLPSRTILALLPCVATGHATRDMYEKVRHERASIQRRIDELTRARDQLDDVMEHVRRAGLTEDRAAPARV